MIRKGVITIIGAGPGDPELITLKGLRALRKAQVVLYDSLVPHELLQYADHSCSLVFVGKRRGKQEFSQDEINELLVYYAQRYACVVRLKGGDPFVFGRGHEELEYALSKGFSVDVVPGISSALAAPLSAGIPITKRSINESFWVVTGTLSSGELSNDLLLAARSSATIIVLMGLSYLPEIAAMIGDARSANEPFAIIQNATLPTQKTIIAMAGTIMEEAARHQIGTPAVIVVGKVVAEQHLYDTLANHAEINNVKS
jgi:uroporphyrin-III C-methyltransferase